MNPGDVWSIGGDDTGWQTLSSTYTTYAWLPGVSGLNLGEDNAFVIDLDVYVHLTNDIGMLWRIQIDDPGGGDSWVTVAEGRCGVDNTDTGAVHRFMQHLRAVCTPDYENCIYIRFQFKDDGGSGSAKVHKELCRATIQCMDSLISAPECR